MLAEIVGHLPLWQMYPVMVVASSVFLVVISACFYLPRYYFTRDLTWKTQRTWPKRATIMREIKFAFIGLLASVANPCLATWMQVRGYNKLYSKPTEYGWGYLFFSWFMLFWLNEVFQWWWHQKCHMHPTLWEWHKVHHRFSNPTPISVIANHPLDIMIQASPLLWVPFFFPILDIVLYLNYAFVSYFYGAYLHGGFEWSSSLSDPHHKFMITAWHHNTHHHYGHYKRPFNCGFVFSVVDKLGGTFQGPPEKAENGGPCRCPVCRQWLHSVGRHEEAEAPGDGMMSILEPKKAAAEGAAKNGKSKGKKKSNGVSHRKNGTH